MKSLQESLFDRDLADKNPTIRDVYTVARKKGLDIMGMSVFPFFNLSKLTNYDPNCEHTNKTNYGNYTFPIFVKKVISIIMDSPVPTKQDFKTDNWTNKLKKQLGKFIKYGYKLTWNNQTYIYIDMDGDDLIIDIDINNGIGINQFRFEPIK